MTKEEQVILAVAVPRMRAYAAAWHNERIAEGMTEAEAREAFNACSTEHAERMNAFMAEARKFVFGQAGSC
jgi:hypothetical protein